MNDDRRDALTLCLEKEPARLEAVLRGADIIFERTGAPAYDLFLVLGSGLAESISGLEIQARIPLADFPGVPVPTAEGHGRELLSAVISTDGGGEARALIATGRSHAYEGLSPAEICQLSRIAGAAGVSAAVLTNAGGCLRSWKLGDVMVVTDHINLTGLSPFTGPVFTDIFHLWDPELAEVLATHADRHGVYACLRGPEFQTRAESMMMRNNGIDMVGMSTVLEAIALHQLGVRVAGLSVTSDLSFSDSPTTHDDVLSAVRAAFPKVGEAVQAVASAVVTK